MLYPAWCEIFYPSRPLPNMRTLRVYEADFADKTWILLTKMPIFKDFEPYIAKK